MPRSEKFASDPAFLEAALEGLLLKKQQVEEQIREVKALLGRRRGSTSSAGSTPVAQTKRELSPAARKRIAAAQKKRWAEYRKAQAAGDGG